MGVNLDLDLASVGSSAAVEIVRQTNIASAMKRPPTARYVTTGRAWRAQPDVTRRAETMMCSALARQIDDRNVWPKWLEVR